MFIFNFVYFGGGLAKVCSNFKEVLVHVSKFLCTVRLGGGDNRIFAAFCHFHAPVLVATFVTVLPLMSVYGAAVTYCPGPALVLHC